MQIRIQIQTKISLKINHEPKSKLDIPDSSLNILKKILKQHSTNNKRTKLELMSLVTWSQVRFVYMNLWSMKQAELSPQKRSQKQPSSYLCLIKFESNPSSELIKVGMGQLIVVKHFDMVIGGFESEFVGEKYCWNKRFHRKSVPSRGWNSTMESLWWRLPTNCGYTCNEWGIGLEITSEERWGRDGERVNGA